MITINKILENRHLDSCILPLWKLRLKDCEYEELKVTLKEVCCSNEHYKFGKEAALFYAEWWRREYSGGSPSTVSLLHSLGVSDRYEDVFYKLALNGARQLRIKFIENNGRKFYFRTLLLQGGLPISHIRNNECGFNGYKRFLLGLVKEIKYVNVDWNDANFIENLPCINYLPVSFKNDGIFNLSLQIARAIVEENDYLLPYDATEGEWKGLTTELKQEYSKEKKRASFIVNWELSKKEKFVLCYSLDNAKKICSQTFSRTNLAGCFSISLYVQDKYIASYRRMTENEGEYYYLRMDNRAEKFEWKGESVINIQLKGDNNEIENITVPRCFAPNFDTPQIFQENGNKWLLKGCGKESKTNAILFTDEWQCQDEFISVEKIQLNNEYFNWAVFNQSVSLIAGNEVVIFENKASNYIVEFLNWSVTWIQDANYKVLTTVPELLVFDSGNEVVNKSLYKVYFRRYKSLNWEKFNGIELPIGLLEIKVVFPDGGFETEKFYYLGELICNYFAMTSNSGEIQWKWNHGTITNYKKDGLIFQEKLDKHFVILREDGYNDYPETIQFKFNVCGMPSLNVWVMPPFKGVTLINDRGYELPNEGIVAIDSIFRFKVIVVGYDDVPLEIFYQKANSDTPESVVIRERVRKGIHSLSLFEEQVEKMFQLYGFNTFDRSSCVKLYFGNGVNRKHIEIRRFDLDSYMDESNQIHVLDCVGGKEKYYVDKLFAVPVNCHSDNIEEYELRKTEAVFGLPISVECCQYILFSNIHAEEKIIPKFYDFINRIDDDQESRLLLKTKNVDLYIYNLSAEGIFDGDEWKKVLKYFEIAIKHRLPFRTFNCFSAIASKPELMVKMLFTLCIQLDKDDWGRGIIKFENEFAVAYHWISADVWNMVFGGILNTIPEILKLEICKVCIESQRIVLELTLNTKVEGLISYALQGGRCRTVNSFSRADIQEMRSRIMGRAGNNNDLPRCHITNVQRYFNLDGATNYQITCLQSPVKAAETLMGKGEDLWENNESALTMRRTINFYRSYLTDIYNEILINVVMHINAQML